MSSWHSWQAWEPAYSTGWVAAGGVAGAPGLSWAPHMAVVNSAATARSMARTFPTGRNMAVISPLSYWPACTCNTSKAVPAAWQTLQLSPNFGSVLRSACAYTDGWKWQAVQAEVVAG